MLQQPVSSTLPSSETSTSRWITSWFARHWPMRSSWRPCCCSPRTRVGSNNMRNHLIFLKKNHVMINKVDGMNGTTMMENQNLLMDLPDLLRHLQPLLPQLLMALWGRLHLCDVLVQLELQVLDQLVCRALQLHLFLDLVIFMVVEQSMSSPWLIALCWVFFEASDCFSLPAFLQRRRGTS